MASRLKMFLVFLVFVLSKANADTLTHVSDKNQFVLYIVPKTGYTSLLSTLKRNDTAMSPQLFDLPLGALPNYFKFAFTRNPWDRLVSAYENIIKHAKVPAMAHLRYQLDTFEKFIYYLKDRDLSTIDVHMRLQTVLIPIEEMNFIGRFENLHEDWQTLMDLLNLQDREIRHLNKSEHVHYSHYYDDITREIVAEKYKSDIETFNYAFEEDPNQ